MKRIGSLAESGYCSGLENRSQPKGCIGSNPIASALFCRQASEVNLRRMGV